MEMDERAMMMTALPPFIAIPLFFLSGLLLGYVYFRALHETANLIVNKGPAWIGLALTAGRFALAVAVLYLAVRVSGLALLAALAGMLIARALMIRRMKRTKA
ncbi:ATP synthase subunit I [Primorskyibacter sp. 2E233]|uniref:N-ATPase subunit AtpR n=1 Tax=Primorskyibacter sp. 2E233 TaxID=3413431 RepID=UPI003BF2FA03